MTAPVSRPIKQVQVQKKRNPDCPKTDPKVDGKRERFEKNQCIGITRGGRNTKIHAVVDALGNPIHVQLSSGDIHDSIIAEDVLAHIDLKPNETTVLADKAYGSFDFREYIANRDTDFCIPPKSNAVDPWYCDWFLYKERHLVECFFNKLKENAGLLPGLISWHLGSSLSSILVVFAFSLYNMQLDRIWKHTLMNKL